MPLRGQAEKAAKLLGLHQGPKMLVFPNVWDVASAKLVERAGFPAIATSSAGIAFALGYPDGQRIRREEMLSVVARIAARVSVPVTADLEAGYGESLEEIAHTAEGLIEAGAVGLNFEDGTGDRAKPLAEVADQMARIRTIRQTGERAAVHIVINARTDAFLDQVGEPALRFDETVRRANAYREAGADCLFIPGVQDAETIGKLVKAVHGPINILAGPAAPTMGELERLGVRRASFGSWPMRAATTHFDRFVKELSARGTFASLDKEAVSFRDFNKLYETP
jgi:2-methylisocitrate lyase-like PEP mutase family enzyme